MNAVSLFAGVGGFDLALTRAGVEVVAAVEIDKHARSVLAKQFPETPLLEDVCNVTGDELRKLGFDSRGIIVGGFPCQDLSVAGKRAGLGGSRSGLFWEIHRLLDETKAEWFILENVPGLLSSNGGRDMGTVLGALAELGYGVAYRVLDAQYFGVPQRRRRVFIVGRLGDSGRAPAKVLALLESLRGNITTSEQTRQDVTASTARGATTTSLGSGKNIANTIPAELYHHGSAVNQDANNGHVVIQTTTIGTLQARDYKDATGGQAIAIQGNMIGRSDTAGPQGKGYTEANNPMFTLTQTDQHAVATSTVRRLTPVECERLQGFPDNWTAGQTDGHRYKQMGNAVAVPVVQWIIDRIVSLND